MLQNYEYFLTLAETMNISRAAKKLYISHQCLSRYLKNLEEECGLTLFERKPQLTLTYAGEILLESLRQIEQVEQNTIRSLDELRSGNTGHVRMGITEGRLRIFVPELLRRYQALYPDVTLTTLSAGTKQMLDKLLNNQLDLVLGSATGYFSQGLTFEPILEEHLYLVVSDNLLRKYFPEDFAVRRDNFAAHGADLSLFQEMPFCITNQGLHSRTMVDDFLIRTNLSLHYIYEAAQPDLLHILTAQDYGASFCLSMYLPNIHQLNRNAPEENKLNVFPIRDFDARNPIYLISQEGRYLPNYTKALSKLIKQLCREHCSL